MRRALVAAGGAAVLTGLAGAVAAPLLAHPASAAVLHRVHTPGTVVDDAHLLPGSCHLRAAAGGAPLPDPACTPGAVDPALTRTVICAPGWSTDSVRPSSGAIARFRTAAAAAYRIDPAGIEYDHLVSLELGGASATSNMWPEPPGPGDAPRGVPNRKDRVEGTLHRLVCAGTMSLADAQRRIAADWTTALNGTGAALANPTGSVD